MSSSDGARLPGGTRLRRRLVGKHWVYVRRIEAVDKVPESESLNRYLLFDGPVRTGIARTQASPGSVSELGFCLQLPQHHAYRSAIKSAGIPMRPSREPFCSIVGWIPAQGVFLRCAMDFSGG